MHNSHMHVYQSGPRLRFGITAKHKGDVTSGLVKQHREQDRDRSTLICVEPDCKDTFQILSLRGLWALKPASNRH